MFSLGVCVGAEVVPEIGAVMAAQAKIEHELAALLLLQRPQHQTESLAVGGVHMLKKLIDRDVERARIEPELALDVLDRR